jgi:hypothetical protein
MTSIGRLTHECKVGLGTTLVVGFAIRTEESLGFELHGVVTPEFFRDVRSGRCQNNGSALGDEVPCNSSVDVRDPQRQRHRCPETQDLGAYGLEIVAAVDVLGCDVRVERWN